ncbi:MAG: carboxypeptidase regulatory-like domain-containing protein [Nitrospirae bacterium]|nr:carboxypeptidase regulatory-like domain-containing protein [Nitrospirota bacterium]MBI5695622.1 carboxypeptidase regulatory-like domain-containing protein [Nitrospirota bacterium]
MRYTVRLFAVLLALSVLAGCAQAQKPVPVDSSNSGIKGQVLFENKGAAEGVFVYAYDSPYNDMRVPTKLISDAAGEDGSYTLHLPPGKYWIVARKRVSGDPRGYLVKGDYEGKYHANPVVVRPGQFAPVNLSVEKLEGAFLLAPYNPDSGKMGIAGTVYTEDGKPASGAYVMLYKDKEIVGQPILLSRATGDDGAYEIYLTEPGTYYVAARLKYGGLPRKGEPYGTYDANTEHMVTVGDKEVVTGIDIKLSPFPLDLIKPAK